MFFYKLDTQRVVGFTASKKIGNAVKRNFAKRRMRALFIKHIDRFKDGIFVFVAKKEIVEKNFDAIEKEFLTIFKRLES